MQRRLIAVVVFLVTTSTCFALEHELLGSWVICGVDSCTVMTLKSDHTFTWRWNDRGAIYTSGTWHAHDNELSLHFTWEDSSPKILVGQKVRYVVSDVRHSSITLARTDKKEIDIWKRHE